MVNYEKLGYKSIEEYQIDFKNTLLPTNHTYDYFVSWERVFSNLKDKLVEISILNSLNKVPSTQLDEEFKDIN